MQKQKIKTYSKFSFAKKIRGLASKLAELEQFYFEEVKNAKYWQNSSGHITLGDFKTATIFFIFWDRELPKIGLHTKKQVSISKNKKMAAVLKSPSVIWPEEFRQYFAFFTSSH